MKTLKIISLGLLIAFFIHYAFKYFGMNGFINGWASATGYFALIVYNYKTLFSK